MNNVIENALVLGVLVLVITIPIYIINRKAKANRKKALEEKVRHEIQSHGLNISKADFFGHKYLGFDEDKKILLFIKGLPDLSVQLIDVKPASEVAIEQKSHEGVLRSVNLRITRPGDQAIMVPVYESNTDNETRLKNFNRLAERWKDNLSGLIV